MTNFSRIKLTTCGDKQLLTELLPQEVSKLICRQPTFATANCSAIYNCCQLHMSARIMQSTFPRSSFLSRDLFVYKERSTILAYNTFSHTSPKYLMYFMVICTYRYLYIDRVPE